MEPECFYFLRLAAAERDFEAAEVSLTVGNWPHALDCFSQIRVDAANRRGSAATDGPTYAARMSKRALKWGPQ